MQSEFRAQALLPDFRGPSFATHTLVVAAVVVTVAVVVVVVLVEGRPTSGVAEDNAEDLAKGPAR